MENFTNNEQLMAANNNEQEMLPIEEFLSESYAFRYNVLSGKTEVRVIGASETEGGAWHHLDEKAMNSIALAARRAMPKDPGLKALIKDIIFSEATPCWDPVRAWLEGLPAWDGLNRVDPLFSLLPGITSEQRYWLAVWLRSVVTHWLQLDGLHGNEAVVTLIGDQGCGKSTFCRRLLPDHLREYFLDHVNLANRFDKEMALTNNLLVNIDELDQIRPSQQAELKQMLSKVRVNSRRIWAGEQTDSPRYASFVATTNNRHPLHDRTGSRRYICVEITHGREIDNTIPIDYDQLYAQVLAELERGERSWFTSDEVRAIQRANMVYQDTVDMETMVETCFRQPEADEYTRELTTGEVLEVLMHEYPAVKLSSSSRSKVGAALKNLGFTRRATNKGRVYLAVPLVAA